ncbi:phage major capsid protein [Clostridium kluyveri]|uniref:Predicted major capsid phage protein n=2 Tax=Clostridium kluyveri TaxID=1534 RepID=A5F9J3_CLOK5|nr:phage major capsid protein [Clostridium kluyveri]ABQ23665.1 predicted major capsid phage protein [Clostridium kluyveri DSM 555]BAH08567.1 hypothetical protein CKR_P48 [Clostridium kluyveri NBRC 12016]
MAKTLFEMKQDLITIGTQLQKVENEIAEKAVDPKVTTDDLNKLTATKADLKTRFDLLKAQHDQLEAEQKTALAAKQASTKKVLDGADDEKAKIIKAKAFLIKAVMTKQPIPDDVKAILGTNVQNALGAGSSLGNGDKLLPSTMTQELLTEPMATNPLRGISTFTNITNLEIPKLLFTLDDDDFLADDSATAKELVAEGDTVSFIRNKFKVFCDITETVLNGTETNLVATVQAGLQSGLAKKEKKVAFESTTPTDMSFYKKNEAGTDYLITKKTGSTMYEAIMAALADLEDDYAENAKIVMKKADYFTMIKELANNNTALFVAPPEQILGAPVVFCDLATVPVVGDFRYSHYNYDLNMIYDQDKNVKTGIESFVLTAWIDHKIKLKSAFRLAVVTP